LGGSLLRLGLELCPLLLSPSLGARAKPKQACGEAQWPEPEDISSLLVCLEADPPQSTSYMKPAEPALSGLSHIWVPDLPEL
jgi:hypothetical protein